MLIKDIYAIIVANHVQNVRSSPSFGGSYAESVTVAWDDDMQYLFIFREKNAVVHKRYC